ncbi:MAG TPA: MFS transporter [Solirubrobacteraceae bacterium]|nr:MFS transporter [Solirubrobacteraceae bacterium]
MRSALSSRALRRILSAYTVNRLGSWVGLVALSLAVFDHTHSALAVSALLLAWQALPALVVPAVVARVEASKGRYLLSGLYVFEAIVTGGLVVLLHHFSLPAVLALAALDGTAALAASALLRTELARVARAEATGDSGADQDEAGREAERNANAALNVAFSLAFVTGPVIGGVVVAATGAPAALLIDVGSFAICAALLLDRRTHVHEADADSLRARLRATWRHVNSVPTLRALLLTEILALVFVQAAAPIEVAYVKATLHGGDRGYGLFVTAWGAGAVLASVVFARVVQRSLSVILSVGVLALGVAFLGASAAPTLALACCASLLGGIGNALEWPSLISLVQELTPPQLHGRLMGAVESMASLCLAVGLPLGGALVALSSPRVAFLIIGIGTVAAAAAFVRVTVGLPAAPKRRADAASVAPPPPPGELMVNDAPQ